MKKSVILVGMLLTVAGIVVYCSCTQKDKTPQAPYKLETTKLSRGNINNVVITTGTVEPLVEVEVGTQVSGIIDKIYVDYNSTVSKGQIIAEMDKTTLKSELRATQANVNNCLVEYQYQEKNYARSKVLYEKELISDYDYETAIYQYEKAKSSYENSLSSLEKCKTNLGYATIYSPIDGVVISRAVEEGQTVAAGFSTPTLFTIVNDLKKMEVIADVDEADIGEVKEGQRVDFEVDAYPDDVFNGIITQVRLEATTTSNVVTYDVVINAPNDALKLKPGLTANISIYTQELDNIPVIPSKALRFTPNAENMASIGIEILPETITSTEIAQGNKKYVWIKNGQTIQQKEVETGATNGNITQVISGLSGEEEIIVSGAANTTINMSTPSKTEQSPFMPARPGDNKKK